jgi:hypothetical protein
MGVLVTVSRWYETCATFSAVKGSKKSGRSAYQKHP